jgi:excinuclease ABC subunit A
MTARTAPAPAEPRSSALSDIVIRGAREHNLRDISLRLPRQSLVVITGVSGSGKSSLAFDTLYAEGQRRYVESLSAYARQFLGQMEKPDVDAIEGLSPAIAIEQRGAGSNPRSTVATITEVYDYLRLLFSRLGARHCPNCGTPLARRSVQEMTDQLLEQLPGGRIAVLAPVVRGRKGEYRKELDGWHRQGYLRARIDGTWVELEEPPKLARHKRHDIEVVVDRLRVEGEHRGRLTEALEAGVRLSGGLITVARDGEPDLVMSVGATCPKCGTAVDELEPRHFSFNSPYGACATCDGLGSLMRVDPERVVPDPSLSLGEGALATMGDAEGTWTAGTLQGLAKAYRIPLDVPWRKLAPKLQKLVLYGTGEEVKFEFKLKKGSVWAHKAAWKGVIPDLERRYRSTTSENARRLIGALMNPTPCPDCTGLRLKPATLAVKVDGRNIGEWCAQSVTAARAASDALRYTGGQATIAAPIVKEIRARLGFLEDVGLGYLTLDRMAGTLAGGEAQRIRLATQIGSQLTGVLYILDEPSIGLHHRDNQRLLATLQKLRDLGNTVVVVEHDEDTMRAADWLVDLGPGAGRHGGEVVAAGRPEDVAGTPTSLTGRYLTGAVRIAVPASRRPGNGRTLELLGAREHNLKGVDAGFPLGTFTCVTGVSGSGKSTLVNDILLAALERKLIPGSASSPGAHRALKGVEHLDKVVAIDQSPIGRTPRSNPATYTGAFTFIRDLFANLPEAKVRGYGAGRFSFNVKGGRCEACEGDGSRRIEMHFLPDVFVRCDTCHGRRYNRDTLEVAYRGHSIADVLEMTVEEALEFLGAVPVLRRKLETLRDVGLGYIHLGQSATTLSGGEAQRVKLATELSRVATGRTLYVLDEPTTGLHFEDVRVLLEVLQALVERGNTVIVIEHHLDVIKCADWLIDLGPEGGDRGGLVVAAGTPEALARAKGSHTGMALRQVLRP